MKITDFKAIYVCPDHNPKYHARKLHMDSLLTRIGFTRIEHYKSSTEAYPSCLVNATIDILQKNMDEPFIFLEDDVEFTDHDTVEIDASADAVYLGLSRFGGSKEINKWEGNAKFAPYSESQVRVLNMLSGHAILYISRRYKQAVIDILTAYKGYYNDVLMSRIQADYMVLANKTPSFYQSAKFNHKQLETWTRYTITPSDVCEHKEHRPTPLPSS
jgi:hypothetical protein